MLQSVHGDRDLRRLRVGRSQSGLERDDGVSFEEAASVFLDLDYLLLNDPENPERFFALGFSGLARLLFVVHCGGPTV